MIRDLVSRLASAATTRRGAARASADRAEARLELACTWGAGHLLVTCKDRQDARDLLERVLRRIDPLATVRAHARGADSESSLDGLFALSGDEGPLPLGRRERRQALLRLVQKARSLRRSVFIVVDDGDDATVEQLERLRASIEVTPEAIERLRLVLLGGSALVAKLDDRAARALSSRITARISVAAAPVRAQGMAAVEPETPIRRSLAIAAGAAFALLAYGGALVVFPPDGNRQEPPVASALSAQSMSSLSSAITPVAYVRIGLRGDEPYLGNDLRIPVDAEWTTGSARFPPPPPEVATAAVASPATPPSAPPAPPNTVRPAPRRQAPAVAAAVAPAPAKVAAQLAAGSSIAALVARFR